MIDRIKEMLEREERVALDFVDRHAFLNQDHENEYDREAVAAIAKSSLVVKSILGGGAALVLEDDRYCIPEKDYKYFKIKEPTFNDLIDVAVQAVKDGVIDIKTLCMDSIRFTPIYDTDNVATYFDDEYADGFDYIKSLYTETFVIESEEDILNVKDEAEILFLNGEKGIFADSTKDGHYGFILIANVVHRIPFPLLKGATVIQGDSK
ncbi:MAG: hypothetical protein GX667_04885 [Xanthomonadaceae bacterium]|nr:hypothetical protein [Xanthomonadaceae bacterium]